MALLFLGGFIFLCLIFNVNAQTLTQEEAKKIQQLKDHTILDAATIYPINLDTKTGKNIQQNPYVLYKYIGETVEDATKIIFVGNSDYSNTEKTDDGKIKIYSSNIYLKDTDNFIKKIEKATTTTDLWKASNVETVVDKILSILKTPYVIASTYNSNDGGGIRNDGTTWSTVRNGATGTSVDTGTNGKSLQAINIAGHYYIDRVYIPFNTSAIGSSTTITAGSLYFYATSRDDANRYVDLVSSVLANPTSLATGDFSVGSTKYITETNVLAGDNTNNLNASGLAHINQGGYTEFALIDKKDYDNTTPSDNFACYIATANYTNSSKIPYLLLTTTGGGTISTTTTPLNCIWPTNNDISIITACKVGYTPTTSTSTMSTSSIEMDYYYSPAILYFYVYTLFIACATIVGLFYFLKK